MDIGQEQDSIQKLHKSFKNAYNFITHKLHKDRKNKVGGTIPGNSEIIASVKKTLCKIMTTVHKETQNICWITPESRTR